MPDTATAPDTATVERSVSAHIEADLNGPTEILMGIAVAADYDRADEVLTLTLNGDECNATELSAQQGGRFHLLQSSTAGRLVVDYHVTVRGTTDQASADDLDRFRYIRPSRYCESDQIGPVARAEFEGLQSFALVDAVRNWVNQNIAYVMGSSKPTDGAIATLLERQGVCRDFAHLTVALLRANDLPARVVSVYAPALRPMDFHLVVEACIDGFWYLVDSTGLAPRGSMVRIVTGVDASESAFLTNVGGNLTLASMNVGAVSSDQMLVDDGGRTYLW